MSLRFAVWCYFLNNFNLGLRHTFFTIPPTNFYMIMSKRCHIVAVAMPHIYIYQCNEWNNSRHVRENESFLATKTEAILIHLQSSTLLCKICKKIVPGNVETTSFTIWGKNTSSTTRLQWSRYWYATQRLKKKEKRPNQALQAELRMTGWANSECKLLTRLNVGKAELYRAG